MPASRSYGGYQSSSSSSSYTSSYYTPSYYSPGSYSTYRSSASTYSPSSARATTPSRSMISSLPDDRKREFRSFGLTPLAAPAAYKYFSRSDVYNTTAIYNRSMTSNYSATARKELKTVKTEDLDVEGEKETRREHAIPGEIKRDTVANIAGGKQVIRLVTTNRKTNPYNIVSSPSTSTSTSTSTPKPATEELSLGQRLAMKHIIVDPKEKEKQEAAAAAAAAALIAAAKKDDGDDSSDAESEWTWETCSESEYEELEKDKKEVKNSTSTSSTASTTASVRPASSNPITPITTTEKKAIPTYPTWMRTTGVSYAPLTQTASVTTAATTPATLPKPTSSIATPSPSSAITYKRSRWLEDASNINLKVPTLMEDSSSSSSNSVGSPKIFRRYDGAGSRSILEIRDDGNKSDDDSGSDNGVLNIGWRRGQPPRSDVVVKMTQETAARVTNKILVQGSKSDSTKPTSYSGERKVSFSMASIVPSTPTSVPTTPTLPPTSPFRVPSVTKTFSAINKTRPEVVLPELKYATESHSECPVMGETTFPHVPQSHQTRSAGNASMVFEGKCHVMVAMQTVEEEPVAFNEKAHVGTRQLEAKIHEDNLSFAKVAPKLSKCSEVVEDLSEDYFETSNDFQDFKICPEEVITTLESLDGLEQQPVEKTVIAFTWDSSHNTSRDLIKNTTSENDGEVKVSKIPIARMEKASEVLIEAVKLASEKNQAVIENLPCGKIDACEVTTVNEVFVSSKSVEDESSQQFQLDNGVKAKRKKNDVEQVKPEQKQKKKIKEKEKLKQKKVDKERRAVTPPPSENRLVPPPPSTALSTSLPSSTQMPAVIPDLLSPKGPSRDLCESEEAIIATQLSRIPSPFRKVFEIKSMGENYHPEKPKDGSLPKYWNNDPKLDEANSKAFLEMAHMKAEVKKHKEKIKQEQAALINNEEEADEVWYKDESSEFQEQLRNYEHMPSDHQKNSNERKTPEENARLVKLYGGIQFPGDDLDKTPPYLLKGGPALCPMEAEEDAAVLSDTVVANVAHTTNVGGRQRRRSVPPSSSNYHNEPPVRKRPQFRKYGIDDFFFHRVLGKGSFGKVILAELRDGSHSFYAVKCLKKDLVLEDDDIECTLIERKVLTLGCKHPFICHLFCTFQTESHLFFAMEYLNGGDLMFHIQQSTKFDMERAKFYSSEVLLALKFLHKKGIVYRDLKLDNVLLDHEGHIRLADFGMCKLQIYLDRMTDTFCGTPDYMAPEIIKGLKYTYCVDWWSFGVLLYEMLMGQSPFNGCDEDELFWSICNEQPFYPKHLTKETKSLLMLLLDKDPSSRLGVKGCRSGDICDQSFFRGVNFDQIEKKQVIPPFKPQLRHPLDVSNFESAFTADEPLLTPVEKSFLDTVNQTQFKGFSYTNPNYALP